MSVRQSIVATSLFLLLAAFSVTGADRAGAVERWPPWQSYGEAEDAARQKALKRKAAAASELASLKRQVQQLKDAGKYPQALQAAQRLLAQAEKKGGESLEVAEALETLAGVYEAQDKSAEAEPLLKRALAIRESTPGQPGAAATRERLAAAYIKLGKPDAAAAVKAEADRKKTEEQAQRQAAEAEAAARRGAELLAKKSGGGAANGGAATSPKVAISRVGDKDSGSPPAKSPDVAAAAPSPQPAQTGNEAEAAAKAEMERKTAEEQLARERDRAARTSEEAARASEADNKSGEQGFSIPPADAPAAGADAEPAKPEGGHAAAQEKSADEPAEAPVVGEAAPSLETPAAPSARDGAPAGESNRRLRALRRAPPLSAPAEAAPTEAAPPPPAAEAPAAAAPEEAAGGAAAPAEAAPESGAAEPAPSAPGAADGAGAAPPPPAKVTASPSGGAAVAANADWQVVPVYWGTDRAVQPNAKRLAFGSDRARKLQLGVANITVPKVHEVPKVERPWVVKIPYFDVTVYAESEDPKKHFTVESIKALSKEELLAQVKERLKNSNVFKDQALVFVHGYNTSFDNALYRTAQIAYDLGFDSVPFVYSWPSGGAVASYTYDRESAQASEPYLRQFLEMVAKETGAKQVSIIAHSMGNQPLMDVLRDMRSAAPEGVEISQVILAAPDVDADSFANLANAIKGLAHNVTLYVASNDRALIVSRNFWGSYRAGDVPPAGPLVLPGIDTIDVTAASTDVFAINHSGYAVNNRLLGDIGELLKTGLRPPEMRALKPGKVSTQTGDYWRYAPSP